MIRIQGLDKTYNARSANPIHVLNHLDVTFEDKGLVVLLGPSGSGKTTLLNVVGGLDKADQGVIEFYGQTIPKYRSSAWDVIRNQHVGTIFQNYYLLNDETVYENIALTLRMIGLTEPQELHERVDLLLKAVKMEAYKNRKASQLSGGQQQRIAIARALAKNPDVILADEPTGNLDSRNTLAIMRMIRMIADHKLVIMVTHEEHLARQFANRILRLRDGQIISDEVNQPVSQFNLALENEIYLKDLTQAALLTENKARFQLHHDASLSDVLDVHVVVKDQTIYIKIPQANQQKVVIVDDHSEVMFKEGSAKDAVQETTDALPTIDLEALPKPLRSKKRRHVLSGLDALRMAFKKIAQSSRGGKLLYLGFALAGAVIALAGAFLGSIFIIHPSLSRVMPVETVAIERNQVARLSDFTALEALPGVLGSTMSSRVTLDLRLPPLYQNQSFATLQAPWLDAERLSASDLIHGRLPQAPNEVVIDRFIAEDLMTQSRVVALGVNRLDLFLNMALNLSRYGLGEVAIVGVANGVSQAVYGDPDIALAIALYEATIAQQPYSLLSTVQEDLTLLAGRFPQAANEIVQPRGLVLDANLEAFEPRTVTLFDQTYTVVGVFEKADDGFYRTSLMTVDAAQAVVFARLDTNANLYLYTTQASSVIRALEAQNINASDVVATREAQARSQNLISFSGLLIFTIIALVASSLSFYFIIRTSMIERIYDLGVYRSLGISRWDIQKLFVIEGALLTTMSSVVGYFAMSYLLYQIQNASLELVNVLQITPLTLGVGVVFIYLINLGAGLLPISLLLRKTPSEINAQYDI